MLLQNNKLIALDVGAQGGFNSDEFISKEYNKFFEPIMIEPIKEESDKLKKKYKYVLDKALWSSEITKKIYILEKRLGSSSMYEPDPSSFKIYNLNEKECDQFQITRTENINCEPLSLSLKKISINKLHYLKIDTQGSELEILRGMKEHNPLLMRIEVQILPMYKNIPPWTELVNFIDKMNYMLCDWKPIGKHATRVPAEMDMIFIPNYRSTIGKKFIIENQNEFISLMLIFSQLSLLKLISEELNFKSKNLIKDFNDRFFY